MAQTDYSIANSSGAVFRARVNEVNAATKSSNSGPTAPSDPVAGMLWFDTSVSPPVLRQRHGANDGWVSMQDASTITGLGELATRDRATVAQIRSLGSDAAPTAERIAEAAALITPSGAADWAPDWTAFLSASWVLTGNRTLQNPTNAIPGTTRVVRAAGDSGTGRTISFGSNYEGDLNGGPVTNESPILYTLFAATATEIWVSAMEAD